LCTHRYTACDQTKNKEKPKQKSTSIRNQKRVKKSVKGSLVGIDFLWWEGFMEKIGLNSGMKMDGVMDDDRGEDDHR